MNLLAVSALLFKSGKTSRVAVLHVAPQERQLMSLALVHTQA